MFQQHQMNTDMMTNNFSDASSIVRLARSSKSSTSIYPKLATLSQQKQWILYTSNCPRPVQSVLEQHQINCRTIIHMKPSSRYSEEEIVIKAIEAGTACAVVASANIGLHARAQIQSIASRLGCVVFYLDQNSNLNHLCH